jgi:hypothetical protein
VNRDIIVRVLVGWLHTQRHWHHLNLGRFWICSSRRAHEDRMLWIANAVGRSIRNGIPCLSGGRNGTWSGEKSQRWTGPLCRMYSLRKPWARPGDSHTTRRRVNQRVPHLRLWNHGNLKPYWGIADASQKLGPGTEPKKPWEISWIESVLFSQELKRL